MTYYEFLKSGFIYLIVAGVTLAYISAHVTYIIKVVNDVKYIPSALFQFSMLLAHLFIFVIVITHGKLYDGCALIMALITYILFIILSCHIAVAIISVYRKVKS